MVGHPAGEWQGQTSSGCRGDYSGGGGGDNPESERRLPHRAPPRPALL